MLFVRLLIIGLFFALPTMGSANKDAIIDRTQIKQLQKQLVSLAAKQRRREDELSALSVKQARLDARITDARTKIEENRDEIDGLLQSLIRLSRTPPEAVIAMPGELRKTLQAAQLMTNLTEQMQGKTKALASLLKRLQSDELELAETRESLKQQQQKLLASRKALEDKLSKRKRSYEANSKTFKKRQSEIAKAKKEAQDVKQLVTKLEKKREVIIQPIKQAKKKVVDLSFTKRRGNLSLPVAGRISKRFGQKTGEDQTSHGYNLASTAGATVTTPASGEVMFTGPFLNYDNIVIIRYDSGYHLLLAGLDKINCSVGQKLVAGEPVGRLKASQNSKADLYMELRRNGKPVDPSPWFG